MRILKNFLIEWMSYYAKTEVPPPYALWSGIWAVNSMLQDKVYYLNGLSKIFPNAYIFLIGPSGGGKSTPSRQALSLLKDTQLVDWFAGEMSKSYMTKYLDALVSKQAILNPTRPARSRLSLYSDELGITVGSGPQAEDFLRLMTMIYDFDYQYGTHKHSLLNAQEPIINWLALTTIPWLRRSVPADLIDSGFIARVIATVQPLSHKIIPKMPSMDPQLRIGLIHDLIQISQLEGEYSLSPDASDYHEKWYIENRQFRLGIEDEITQGIYGRENEHAIAIAMTLMASAGDEMQISLRAIENAIKLVKTARASNVQLFRALANTDRKNGGK